MATIEDSAPGSLVVLDGSRPVPAAVIDLRDLGAILRRQRRWILWPVVVCTIGALLVALAMPARYKATAQILLDLQGLRVLQGDLTPRDQSGEAQLAEAESQLSVVSSGNVLKAVVEREKLKDDPEFGAAPTGLLSSILGQFTSSGSEDRALKALQILRRRLETGQPNKSFVIDLSAWSVSPAKAARLANAVAAAYLDQDLMSKNDAAKRTDAALVSRLAELQERVSRSAHLVEDYKAQNKIVAAGGQLVNEQQLSEVNNQLVLARTATAEQGARYEDIQRLMQNHAEPDAIAEVIHSPSITALRSRYAEAKQKEANASAILGPRHPTVQAAAAEVEQSRRRVDEEVSRIARTALSDYNRARSNEDKLERNLDALKAGALITNDSLVRLRELERQAESDRAIYNAFLNRAKEVAEQVGVENSNSRIITPAVPPASQSGPPRMLIVAGSCLIGLIGGIGLALLREQFDPAILSERELVSELGLRILAVLPNSTGTASPVFAAESRQAAAMHRLLNELRSTSRADGGNLVLVMSPDNSDVRSVIALNLAICAGADGDRVLLVNDDPHHHRFMTGASRVVRTPWDQVEVLRVPLDGSDLQAADELCDAIAARNHRYDLIVIDCSLRSSDPAVRIFASFVDDIVMVVQSGYTSREGLRAGIDVLGSTQTKLAGAVLAR